MFARRPSLLLVKIPLALTLALVLASAAGCAHDPPATDPRLDPAHVAAPEGRPPQVGRALSPETALPPPRTPDAGPGAPPAAPPAAPHPHGDLR